ncbi:hypothetical protein Lal_00039547 [Lupinus albus]|uniref:Uncharacterized protein n=1 Tax=Lupinus albus TaxID=3870 RepID=A0A6A5NKT5_LUPAL|nr:putative protein kinase RLK-Pelle-LysM family [Lupinus albus]KAF1885699.1 hypothetical protein Lal_00039547 [Lupinus albus]
MTTLVLFLWLFVPTFGQDLLSCETTSPEAFSYHCNNGNSSQNQCETFALIFTNSYYSSLSNLTTHLGLNKFVIAEANGFSAETEFLSQGQPLLIPIHCKCKGDIFRAELSKISIKGESFYGITNSLEGLTTCKAIRENNPTVSPWNLDDKVKLVIPLRCACPFSSQLIQEPRFLLSYPVSEGDTISNLASKFNITKEAIISANKVSSSEEFRPENLTPFTSILIPLNGKPFLGPLVKPMEPNSGSSATRIPVISPHKKSKMWKNDLYIGLGGVAVGVFIASVVAFFFMRLKKHKKLEENSIKEADLELEHLNLSVRTTTTNDKKVSFEGSQDTLDGKIVDLNTPRKMLLEIYTNEDMRKATEDFNSSNLIEGSVFRGRLIGKDMAIKRTKTDIASKIDLALFHDAIHHHPNILRLLGTSLFDGPESFIVFEFAKNGSLKDWLHGGLAIKNQFISSCYCFLTWSQRLKICLDVAAALQYMHEVMNPSYLHRNVKSRNIFLDEEFGAKLGNFGMAGCVENETEDPNFYSTNPASWSIGYLAPEYVHQGIISPSIDIFAYGVVLLEVLSAQTPISRPNDKADGSVWLTDKIKSISMSKNVNELREWIDNALGENYSLDAVVSVANIARACVEEDASLRPSAREIVEKLSRLVEELPEGEHNMLMSESSSSPLVNEVGKIL